MKLQLAALAASIVLLGACHRPSGNSNQTTQGGGGTDSSTSFSSATFRAPEPPPFQTVEIKNDDGTVLEALQARGEVGKHGGTMRLSTFGSDIKTLNTWDASDVTSKGIGLLQFERLVELDPWTGEYYPRLAKSFTISPDNKTYTFVLRKGLKWSDGKPITADDVVFTFDTLVKKGYGQDSISERDGMTVYNSYPKVEKIDDLTVRFTTKLPFAPFLSAVNYTIAPKHILEPVTKKALDQFGTFWDIHCDPKTMVGSGPFILERYVPGQRVELKRNPNYFMFDKAGKRLPYLDRFVVNIVPDQNTQAIKFYAGEIDMLDVRSVRGADVTLMKQRQAERAREHKNEFTMYNLGPDDGTVFMALNLNQRKDSKSGKYYVNPIKQKWFNNDYFRQAISHAVDRERIIANAMKGIGQALYSHETTAALFYNKDLKPYPQDLKLAAELLKQGGFVLKDGQLFDSVGNRVEFTLNTNAGNTVRDAICVSIKDDLGRLGIKVNYQPVDFNILLDKTQNSQDWEAIIMGLSGSKIEPHGGANVWKSDGRLHMFDQRMPDKNGKVTVTDARDWEKEIDQVLDKAATTLGTENRRPFYNRWQEIIYNKVPMIYIESPLNITAISNKFGNYMPTELGISYTPMGSLHNIQEIYLKESAK